jgi:hypothetical protein
MIKKTNSYFVNKMHPTQSSASRRAEDAERMFNNKDLRHALRMTAKKNKAQETK